MLVSRGQRNSQLALIPLLFVKRKIITDQVPEFERLEAIFTRETVDCMGNNGPVARRVFSIGQFLERFFRPQVGPVPCFDRSPSLLVQLLAEVSCQLWSARLECLFDT